MKQDMCIIVSYKNLRKNIVKLCFLNNDNCCNEACSAISISEM